MALRNDKRRMRKGRVVRRAREWRFFTVVLPEISSRPFKRCAASGSFQVDGCFGVLERHLPVS